VNRREFLGALVFAAGAKRVDAHTPYGQWVVYRKKHLLIGSHRTDPETYVVAKELASLLVEHLPKSKSRVARAPTAQRLASLLGTDQLDLAVLARADAVGMLEGTGRFEPYGVIPLKLLAKLDSYLLVAHERFPLRHAWLVAAAIHTNMPEVEAQQMPDADLRWHAGALSFFKGEEVPDSQ
jgi:hypothetical protein